MHNHIKYRTWNPEQFHASYREAVEEYHACKGVSEGRGCDDCRGLSDTIFIKRGCECPEGEAQLRKENTYE